MAGEEPVSVAASEFTDRNDIRFREVEDRIAWTFQFPSGLLGQGFSSYSSGHNHIRLTGDKGAIDLEPGTAYGGHSMRVRIDGKEQKVTPPRTADANQFSAQLDHLSQSVLSGREPIASGEEGLRDLRIIEAIYRSAKEGRTIRI
jgi:glucose-fructose oxidoreductase